MSSGHDARQRAVICQDCWFWKEMSCALPNPESGVCANKRPIQGRRAAPVSVDQPTLTPLAVGHAMRVDPAASSEPFTADAPEATFSLAQLHPEPVPSPVPAAPAATPVMLARTSPPSFQEIRSGRTAAASRAPVATLQIPDEEASTGTLLADAAEHGAAMPCLDQLVARVRQRTAARLSRYAQAPGS